MNDEARTRFEAAFRQVLHARFGGTWELERLDDPAPPARGKRRRRPRGADVDPSVDRHLTTTAGRAPKEHAVEDRG